MELSELLSTKPQELARKQEMALAKHVEVKLRGIADLIKRGCYEDVLAMLEPSPDDGSGDTNRYIDFSEIDPDGSATDIGYVIDFLICLRKAAS